MVTLAQVVSVEILIISKNKDVLWIYSWWKDIKISTLEAKKLDSLLPFLFI